MRWAGRVVCIEEKYTENFSWKTSREEATRKI